MRTAAHQLHHGLREIAIGLLDQPAILPVQDITVEGEFVGIAGKTEEIRPLPDQVQRQIGET